MEHNVIMDEIKNLMGAKTPNFKELDLVKKEVIISSLCQNIDPYSDLQNPEILKVLRKVGIKTKNLDPFTLTNKLLVMLDDIQTKIENSNNVQ